MNGSSTFKWFVKFLITFSTRGESKLVIIVESLTFNNSILISYYFSQMRMSICFGFQATIQMRMTFKDQIALSQV